MDAPGAQLYVLVGIGMMFSAVAVYFGRIPYYFSTAQRLMVHLLLVLCWPVLVAVALVGKTGVHTPRVVTTGLLGAWLTLLVLRALP